MMYQDEANSDKLFDWLQTIFKCSLSADERKSVENLEQVHALLVKKMAGVERHSGSLSAGVFYRVRRALSTAVGVSPRAVQLDMPLNELIGREHRHAVWNRFLKELPFKLEGSDLEFPAKPKKFLIFAAAGCMAGLVISGLLAIFGTVFLYAVVGFFVVQLFLLIIMGTESHNPKATEFPSMYSTPRKIVNELVGRKYGTLARELKMWDEQEVWLVLARAVSDFSIDDCKTFSKSTRLNEVRWLD